MLLCARSAGSRTAGLVGVGCAGLQTSRLRGGSRTHGDCSQERRSPARHSRPILKGKTCGCPWSNLDVLVFSSLYKWLRCSGAAIWCHGKPSVLRLSRCELRLTWHSGSRATAGACSPTSRRIWPAATDSERWRPHIEGLGRCWHVSLGEAQAAAHCKGRSCPFFAWEACDFAGTAAHNQCLGSQSCIGTCSDCLSADCTETLRKPV